MLGQSHRRLARAEAARTLLELHARDALAEPERWTWDVLDRLPLWCLLDAERRRRLQLTAGAVLLAPELRLWLERERLAEVAHAIGEAALERLLDAADAIAAARPDVASPAAGDEADDASNGVPFEAPDGAPVEARLLGAGAAVLLATLHPSLPLGGLAESLGEPAGVLAPETAEILLGHAERLVLVDAEPESAVPSAPAEVARA